MCVQIMPLRPKMAPPRGHIFYKCLYRESMKNSSCLKSQGLESGQAGCAHSGRIKLQQAYFHDNPAQKMLLFFAGNQCIVTFYIMI